MQERKMQECKGFVDGILLSVNLVRPLILHSPTLGKTTYEVFAWI
jgi:hypothetical protein